MKQETNNQVRNGPIPPDGGWGWVIVTVSLMCNVIAEGIIYSAGVSLPKLVTYFDEGKGIVAWAGSLLGGVHLAIAPVGSVLINKYGCRVTCIIGSIIAMASFAFSALCNSLILLMIIYGIFGGIGLGLIYLPTIVCVGQYFDKKRALAMGITACGTGIGSFVMAPLTASLLDRYDWKGTNLILAGIILNCAIFGSLMRPLELPKMKQRLCQGETNFGCDFIEDPNPNSKSFQIKLKSSIEENVNEEVRAPLINFRLMKKPVFLLVCASSMIGYLGFLTHYVYIIDVAITTGIEYETASFLVSIIGITNMIGRILSGYISDFPTVDALTVTCISTGISGVAVLSVPFCSNFFGFAVVASILGLFTAPFIALASIILVNLVGISQLADAFGLELLMVSVPAIIGAPLVGLLFDLTASYNWTFWVSGALLIFASFLFAITYCVWYFIKRRGRQTR